MFQFTLSEDGKYYILTNAFGDLPSKVEIPARYEGLPVKEIGEQAFFKKRNIKRIDLPEGITKIGKYAFSCMTSLEEVFFNEGVLEICDNAFAMCENLVEVYLPNTLKTIGISAFGCCKKLAEINVVNVTLIKNNAFDYCESLKRIVFDKTTEQKKLYGACFKDCTNLEEVVFSSSVVIYDTAFENTGIEDLEIPDGSTLSKGCFANCKNLQSLTVGKKVTFSNYAHDYSIFSEYRLEKEEIFNGSDNLKTLVLKERNPYAIRAIEKTVEHIIFDGAESIERNDIYHLSNLRKITLTPSVKKIEAWAIGLSNLYVFRHPSNKIDDCKCPRLREIVVENFKGWQVYLPKKKKPLKIKDKVFKNKQTTIEFMMNKYKDCDWVNVTKFSDKMKKN